MSGRLKIILSATAILAAISITGQEPDRYDTLTTRSSRQILVPRYDTLKQLQEINLKADTILSDLQLIKCKLGIRDDADTNKTPPKPKKHGN